MTPEEIDTQADAIVERLERDGVEEDVFDDIVHDLAQEGGLADLNNVEDEDGQEDHISEQEAEASDVNNGGFDAQVRFLLKAGWTAEQIIEFADR